MQSWLAVLKDDRKLVVSAAAQAERAAECVLEPSRKLAKTVEAERRADRELEMA